MSAHVAPDRMDLSGVEPQRVAGVALDHVRRFRLADGHRHTRALTAREALKAIHFEVNLIWTTWASVKAGVELSRADSDRVNIAMGQIDAIVEEAVF